MNLLYEDSLCDTLPFCSDQSIYLFNKLSCTTEIAVYKGYYFRLSTYRPSSDHDNVSLSLFPTFMGFFLCSNQCIRVKMALLRPPLATLVIAVLCIMVYGTYIL
jgi:hypothetical protein